MSKTLADLLRLCIVLMLIILAYHTLPVADPAQHTPTTGRQQSAGKTITDHDGNLTNHQQNGTEYYLPTSIRTRK